MASDPQSSVIALSDDDSDFEQEPLAQPAPRRLRAGPSRQRSSSQPSTSATASRPKKGRCVEVNLLPTPSEVRLGGRRQGSRQQDVVDLTKLPDDEVLVVSGTKTPPSKRRRKNTSKPVSHDPPQSPTEMVAKCGICFDKMEEMACGPCGHVFCNKCLRQAVKAQKKCPSCRRTMQPRQIHRVFLDN